MGISFIIKWRYVTNDKKKQQRYSCSAKKTKTKVKGRREGRETLIICRWSRYFRRNIQEIIASRKFPQIKYLKRNPSIVSRISIKNRKIKID